MHPASPRRSQAGFSFIEILVVMGIITLLTSMVVVVIPLIRERANQTKSKDNVGQLLKMLLDMSLDKGYPDYNGKNFTLAPIAHGRLDPDAPGALEILFSPSDQGLKLGDPARYKEIKKDTLKNGTDYHELTSYAGRLNGVSNKECRLISSDQSAKGTLCLCDDDEGPLHHSSGIVVGFAGGKSDFWDWEQLEMSKPGGDARNPDPFIGEAGTSPFLRCVSSK